MRGQNKTDRGAKQDRHKTAQDLSRKLVEAHKNSSKTTFKDKARQR
jgi:hypothetical protein